MPNDTKHGASGTDSRALMDSWTVQIFRESSWQLCCSAETRGNKKGTCGTFHLYCPPKNILFEANKGQIHRCWSCPSFFTSSETFRMTYHDIPTESNCTIQIVFTSFYLPTDLMILGNRRWKNITEAPETASLYVLRMPQKHGTGSIGTSLPITPMDWFNRKWAGKLPFYSEI